MMVTEKRIPDTCEFLAKACDSTLDYLDADSPTQDLMQIDTRVLIRLFSLFNPKVTQAQISQMLDIPLITISRILSGTKTDNKGLSYQTLSKLSDNIDCNLVRDQIDLIEKMQIIRSGDEAKTELEYLYRLRDSDGNSIPNQMIVFDPFARKAVIVKYNKQGDSNRVNQSRETVAEIILVSPQDGSRPEDISAMFKRFDTACQRKEIICSNNNFYYPLVVRIHDYLNTPSNKNILSLADSDSVFVRQISMSTCSFESNYMVHPDFKETSQDP